MVRVGRSKWGPTAMNSESVVPMPYWFYFVLRAIGRGRRRRYVVEWRNSDQVDWLCRLKGLCGVWFGRVKDGTRDEEVIVYIL